MSVATSNPRLTILLPTHNRADVLPFAIKSVLAQTFTDYELLIVGDGCTDNTAAVVAEFAARDGRIRWLDFPKAPHFGYANRNRALKEARGDIIGFMAHDDIISPDHFALLLEALNEPSVLLVHGGSAWISPQGEFVPTVCHLNDSEMRSEFLARTWNRLPATVFAHRREVFASVGYWDETLPRAGDLDFWCRIIQHYGVESVRSLDTCTTFHFRAAWRTAEHSGPDNEPLWQILHRQPGRLPPELKIPPKAEETEQAAFWRYLSNCPKALPNLRTALNLGLQTYAREMELRTGAKHLSADDPNRPVADYRELEKYRSRAERLREELDRTKEQLASLKTASKVTPTSRSPRWKFWK